MRRAIIRLEQLGRISSDPPEPPSPVHRRYRGVPRAERLRRGSAASKPAAAPAFTIAPVQVTGHFCADANTVMRQQPPDAASRKATLAVARTEMVSVLKATAAGFTALAPEAPASLQGPIKTIIGISAADEQRIGGFGSISAMGSSIVRATRPAQAARPSTGVLTYISRHCA
jgi:hypothetical protein